MNPSRRTTAAIAILGLLTLVGSGARVADAAAHQPVLAGTVNKVSTTTTLSNTKGTPLSLKAKKGSAPLLVNSTTKVKHLNADELDGHSSGAFQQSTTATCTGGTAVATIKPDGITTCTTPPAATTTVVPIQLDLAADNLRAFTSAAGLNVLLFCHDGAQPTALEFLDRGKTAASLNWNYSNGTGTTEQASGVSLAADGATDEFLPYNKMRIEGQFIYSADGFIDTVIIHTVDLTTSCEYTGTVTAVPVPAAS